MTIKTKTICTTLLASCVSTQIFANANGLENAPAKNIKPNIIYILADDMGYGDISTFNPNSKIKTPHIDALAANGIKFTDAHSTSAVCTPSRYGLLTGRYSWRSTLKRGLAWTHTPSIIETDRTTVAAFLKENGYNTGCVGKWHLGWEWTYNHFNTLEINYKAPINYGPKYFGFDYSFCLLSSLDIPPYVYVENNMVTGLPDRQQPLSRGQKFQRSGDIGSDFESEKVVERLEEQAIKFIESQKNSEKPYFLYYPLTAPHAPVLPTKEYLGKSNTTEYGDFCLMVDDVVGKIVQKVAECGDLDNTIIIFTSDNGCAPSAEFKELEKFDHNPNYLFRGSKSHLYEGGHRIPLVIQYPAMIKKGEVSDQLVGLQDFFATIADLLDVQYPDNTAEDSISNLPIWLGTISKDKQVRETLIHHSSDGKFSYRYGDWKLVLAVDSAGWGGSNKVLTKIQDMQLFNIKEDISEEHNLIDKNYKMAKIMLAKLEEEIKNGRSTKGEKQPNTIAYWPELDVLKAE